MTRSVGALAEVSLISARTQVLVQRAHPMAILLGFVQPVALLLIARAGFADPTPQAMSRFAVASGLTTLWAATIWSAGGILRREIEFGTLPRIVCSVWDARLVLVAKSLAATMFNAVTITASSVVVLALLGYPLRVARPGLFVLTAVAAVASATALGLLLSCLFVLTRAAVRISEALTYPVFLLGGILIPLEFLPEWLRWPSVVVSLRWARESFDSAMIGGPVDAAALAMVVLLTAVYAVLGGYVFARVLDRARSRGTLEFR